MSAHWVLVIVTAAGCFGLKLAGYLVPPRWLEHPRVRGLVEMMPVALLAALVVVEAVAQGRHIRLNAPELAGVAVGAVAVWRKAPFLVVVVLAGLTAALLRLT